MFVYILLDFEQSFVIPVQHLYDYRYQLVSVLCPIPRMGISNQVL